MRHFSQLLQFGYPDVEQHLSYLFDLSKWRTFCLLSPKAALRIVRDHQVQTSLVKLRAGLLGCSLVEDLERLDNGQSEIFWAFLRDYSHCPFASLFHSGFSVPRSSPIGRADVEPRIGHDDLAPELAPCGELNEGQMIDEAFTVADPVGGSDLQPTDMCELWIRGPDAARVHIISVCKTSTLVDVCEKYCYMSQFRAQVDGRHVPWITPVHLLCRQVVLIVATGLVGGSPGVHLQASTVDAPCGGDDPTLHCPCVGGSVILNQPKPSDAFPVHRAYTTGATIGGATICATRRLGPFQAEGSS